MKLEELARYDIKLLVAFQVLLEEQNVSRAAERLFVTQSAMSKMMARLNDMFSEELFFRSPHGIQATERALTLRPVLYDTLEQLKALLDPPVFDPALCERTFRISLMDHMAANICPPLLKTLSQVAPKVKLQVKPWDKNSLDDMSTGQLDLAMNLIDIDRANFYEHKLATIVPCAIMRRDHPLTKKVSSPQEPLLLDDFLSYSFIKVVIPEFNDVQQKDKEILDKLGRERDIAFETHNPNSAFLSLLATDYVMLGGRGMNDAVLQKLGLTTLTLPEEIDRDLSFSYKMLWHQRQNKPEEQRWFRNLVLSSLNRPS